MAVEVQQRQERPPLWRNVTVLKWAAQLIVLAGLLILGWILFRTGSTNIEDRGITFSWRWLGDPPGISIREGIDQNPDSGARAMLVGIVNMLRVTVSGILVATVIGTLIGIARLSKNWIVNKSATVYVEVIRNIPLLVQMIFWGAFIGAFAELSEGQIGKYWFHISAKGVAAPWLRPDDGFWQWLVFVIVGLVVARLVYKRRLRRQEETGQTAYAVTWAVGAFVLIAAIGWFAHPVVSWLEVIWGALASFFDGIPTVVMQLVLAAAAIAIAAWWIKRFLDSLRTPAGLAKLTDDDIFRIVFAALVGVAFALLFIIQPGIADLILDGLRNMFTFLEGKFAATDGSGLRTGVPLTASRPTIAAAGNFIQYGDTGVVITPGFFAVWVGVTLYTASFIAEIVRGGILAVARGQTEAASALGLKRSQLLRLVVLPQAFRIVLPPLGNQYLNLAKNTSLGIAVAFPEIVFVGQTIYNQTGQTLPVVLLWMGFYLALSLIISAIVNFYNRRLQLVER